MPFQTLLQKYIDLSNIAPAGLAKRTGIERSTINRWLEGREPRLNSRPNLLKCIQFFCEKKAMQSIDECNDFLYAAGQKVGISEEEKEKHKLNLKVHLAPQLNHCSPPHDTSIFYGRDQELTTLTQWIMTEQCRLVAILGIGGVGKSTLTAKWVQDSYSSFQQCVWISLHHLRPPETTLLEVIKTLSPQQQVNLSGTLSEYIEQLLSYLSQSRYLLVLDNMETVLQTGEAVGQYLEGYEGYGELLKRVGETTHQSCLLLTSREKPQPISILESEKRLVRTLSLGGLDTKDAEHFFSSADFESSRTQQQRIIQHYSGHPVALKIVVAGIREVFDGNINSFLHELERGIFMFNDIRDLLQRQFARLSPEQRSVIYELAILRRPVSMTTLKDEMISPALKREVPNIINALWKRSMIEKIAQGYTLQNVVMEYVTEQFITQVIEEIKTGRIMLLNNHAMMKAQTEDYLRDAQTRLILEPVVEQLTVEYGDKLKDYLKTILLTWQREHPGRPGYLAGNILNLLCHLKSDLSHDDFSQLTVWQAYLPEVKLQGVNFAHADLTRSIFTQAFGMVVAVAWSPDRQWFATGDSNGEVRLWRALEGEHLLTLTGHTGWIRSVAFSPSGQRLASGSEDGTVKIWEVSDGRCLNTLQDHREKVRSVAFDPTGEMLISGGDDCTVKLWKVPEGQCLKTFQAHPEFVLAVAFHPGGHIIASGGDDQGINLWNIETGACIKTLQGCADSILSIALSPDGRWLASGSEDHTVSVWPINQNEILEAQEAHSCPQILQRHQDWVWSVAFSPDSQFLASSSADETIRLWQVDRENQWKCVKILQGHTHWIRSLAFHPLGHQLISGSDDQTLRIWEIPGGNCIKTLYGYTPWLWSIAFSPEGCQLASDSADKKVRLWTLQQNQCVEEWSGHTDLIRCVVFSPHGQWLATGSDDKTIRLWEVHKRQCFKVLSVKTHSVRSMAFSPDHQLLAYCGADQYVRILEIQSGHLLTELRGPTKNWVWSVAFSPEGQYLLSSGDDATIKVWDFRTGQCVETLRGHTSSVRSIAISKEGKYLASGSGDHQVKVWDLEERRCIRTLVGHTNWVWSVTFSPDGSQLASGSSDHTVRVWEVSSGRCLHLLQGHTHKVRTVAFNPAQGKLLVSGSEDRTIKLWNLNLAECLSTLRPPRPYEGMNITGVKGISRAQKDSLKLLGAVEQTI